jgi:nucleotide-binding universal stress UspA family protein
MVPPDRFEPAQETEQPAAASNAWLEAEWKREHDARTRRSTSVRRMLFAATRFAGGVHALQRAYELANRWQATLYVLHVSPPAAQPRAPGEHAAETEQAIAQAVLRRVRRFCDRGLAEVLPRDHMLVRQGEFTEVVAHTAHELDATLVIVPGAEQPGGMAVATIAREAHVPVLVARKSAPGGGIVAATDLGDPGCDELRHAAALAAAQTPGKLAFVHNVKPVVQAATTVLGHCLCTVIEPSAQCLAQCRERLQALAELFGVRADALVVSRPSAEDAILEVAREKGADLIVVGARRQRWLERLFGTALAARIVDHCERSVLVAPLSGQGVLVDRALAS